MTSRNASKKRGFVPPKDEIGMTSGQEGGGGGEELLLNYTVIADPEPEVTPKRSKLEDLTTIILESNQEENEESLDDPEADPSWQACSLCGTKVADLAVHIVDDHTELQDMERSAPTEKATPAKKPVRSKGRYRQVKPVLRYPCDGCRTVAKSSDQLKKHMILAHNGHKNTTWMFCGDCDYATRVEDELVNHVKVHQIFNVLKEDFIELDEDVPEGEEDDYSANPMSCGDCSFETHYESQLFAHLKLHMGKEDEYGPVTEAERIKLEKMAKKEAFVLVDGNEFVCQKCNFRASTKTAMAKHCEKMHGIEVTGPGKKMIQVRQSFYYCTLCPFKGKSKEDLLVHKRNTIHNKKGGTVEIHHNPLKAANTATAASLPGKLER